MSEEISSRKQDSRQIGFDRPADGLYLLELGTPDFRDNRSDRSSDRPGEPYGQGACYVALPFRVTEAEVYTECIGMPHTEGYFVDAQIKFQVQDLLNVFVDLGVMPEKKNFPLNVFCDVAVRNTIEKKAQGATLGAVLVTKKDKEGKDRQNFQEIMTMKEYRARCNSGKPASADAPVEGTGTTSSWEASDVEPF